jgi:hypothetical protein
MVDVLDVHDLPVDAKAVGKCILASLADSGGGKIGCDEVRGSVQLSSQPAGEITASTTDFENTLTSQAIDGQVSADQAVPGRVILRVNAEFGVPVVVSISGAGLVHGVEH